jgi:hypothetical protein
MLCSPHADDDGVPYAHAWLIPQFRTDSALRDRLHGLGVNVEYNCELIDVTQTADTALCRETSMCSSLQCAATYFIIRRRVDDLCVDVLRPFPAVFRLPLHM